MSPHWEEQTQQQQQLMNYDKRYVNLLKRRLYAFIPCVFATVAFCTSYTSNFSCQNIQFVPDVVPTTTTTSSKDDTFRTSAATTTTTSTTQNDFFRPRPVSFGLWMYQSQRMSTIQNGEMIYDEFCVGYDPSSIRIDIKWIVARICSVIGIIISGFLLLWQFAAPFLLFDTNYWRIAIGLFIVLAALQGLTILFVQSSACYDNALIYILVYNPKIYPTDQCTWDTGTNTSIVSLSFYIITVISMLIIPAPGIRPSERPYPMMIWDTTDTSNHNKGSDYENDDDDDDDDDESTSSFACDDDNIDEDNIRNNEILQKYQQHKMSSWKEQQQQDITETDLSYSHSDAYDDDTSFVHGGTKV